MDPDIEKLVEDNGGYWEEHPQHTLEDWQALVRDNETRQGYWNYVKEQLIDREEDAVWEGAV